MTRLFNLNLDLIYDLPQEQISIRKDDRDTTTVEVTATNKGKKFSLKEQAIIFECRLPDGTYIRDNGKEFGNIKVIDEAKGIFSYTFINEAIGKIGKVTTAYFAFEKNNPSLQNRVDRVTTRDFKYKVISDAITGSSGVAEHYVSELNEIIQQGLGLLAKIEEIKENAGEILDTYIEELQKRVKETIEDIQKQLEVSQGDIVNLRYDINQLQEQIEKMDVFTKNEVTARFTDISYNVKSYGAKGDKVTDDSKAIQDLINTVPEGSTIYFPPGTYRITKTIYLRDKIKYTGASWLTRIERDKAFQTGPMLYIKGKTSKEGDQTFNEDTRLESICLDGNKQNDTYMQSVDGLLIEGVLRLFVDDVRISNCAGSGINSESPILNNTIYFQRCFLLENNGHNIYLGGYTSDVHILQCDLGMCGQDNLVLGCVSSTVREATIWGSKTGVGILCTGVSNHITGCQIEGHARHAVSFYGASHCSLSSSKVYASVWKGARGVYITADVGVAENIMVSNNMIYSSLSGGYSEFEKAITIDANHKNITVLGNNVKYLGHGTVNKDKRPYVEGLSLEKGDVWSDVDDQHYIMASFSENINVPTNTYTKLPLTYIKTDLSDLVGEDGFIHIREDGIYTITGHLLISNISQQSTYRLRLTSTKTNIAYTLKYYSPGSIENSVNFNMQLLLEAGDVVFLDFLSTHSNTLIEKGLNDSYIVFSK